MNKNALLNTRWECKYNLVFIQEYRRQVIYGKMKKDVGEIFRRII